MPLDAKDRDELKGMISTAKKRPLNFGICLGKKPEELAIVTHKTQTASALAREAKERIGTAKTVTGTLEFTDGALRLTCPEGAPAGLARRLTTYFKAAKLAIKVVLVDAQGGELEADGTTEEIEDALEIREEEDDSTWAALKRALEPRVAIALKMDTEEATRIRAAWGLANETADEGDYTRAAQIAERIGPMLDKLAPTTGKETGPDAEWKIAAARIAPLVTDALKTGKGDPGKIRAVWDFAQGKAGNDDFAAALAALKPLAQLLAAANTATKTEAQIDSGKTTTERVAGSELLDELKGKIPAFKEAFLTLKDKAATGPDLVKSIPDLVRERKMDEARVAMSKLDQMVRDSDDLKRRQAEAKARIEPVFNDLVQRYNALKDLPAAPGVAELRKAVVDKVKPYQDEVKKKEFITAEPLLPPFEAAVTAIEARNAEFVADKATYELEFGGLSDDMTAMLKISSYTKDIGKLRKALIGHKAAIESLVTAHDYKPAIARVLQMGQTISDLGKAKELYDQDRIAWMTEIGNARQAIAAVEGAGAVNGALDKIRADFLVKITEARSLSKENEYRSARKALAEALALATDYRRDKGKLDAAEEKGFDEARAKAAKTVPDLRAGAAEDGGETLKKVAAAMEGNSDLAKSKGLIEILDRSRIVDKLYDGATQGTSAEALQHVVDNIDAVLKLVTAYQKDHKETGGKGDREKFAQAEAIALHHRLQADQLRLLKPVYAKFEAIDCKALAKTEAAALETLGWLEGVMASAAPAGFRAAAKAKHGELLGALMQAAPTRDGVRKAAAMGGPAFKASFERQDAMGPLSATLKGKGMNAKERHAKTRLQKSADAENVEQARALGTRLIADDGSFELAGLYAFDPDEIAGDSPASQQMAHGLKLLRDDPKAQDILQNIPAPEPNSKAAELIRATLGLAPDAAPSAADARRAALAALTSELRQGQVGSCFGTQVAIRVHDTDPAKFLEDLSAMIRDGGITRNLDGKEVTVNVQSRIDTTTATEPNIRMTRGGTPDLVAGAEGRLGAPAKLEEAPGFQRSMDALGIAPGDRATAMQEALVALQASAEFRRNQNEKALRKAVTKIDDSDERAAVLKRALERLTDDPASVKQALADAMADESIDGAEQTDAKAGFDGVLNAAEFDIEPDKVMSALILKKLGLSEADVDRARACEKLRSEIMTDPDVISGRKLALPGDKALLDKMTLLEKEDKAIAWGKIRQMEGLLETSIKSFVGESQNPLLRAYEYTVSALVEKNPDAASLDEATNVVDDLVADEIDDIVGTIAESKEFKKGKVKEAKLGEIAQKLHDRYMKAFRAGTSTGYDPTVGTEISEDGSSDRGVWRLFDTQGIDNPDKWIAITDAKQYRRLVQGMMMLAWVEEFGKEKDEKIATLSRQIADQLADRLGSEDFAKTSRKAVKDQTGEELSEPWVVDGGGMSANLLKVFEEREIEVEKFGQPADAKDLLRKTGGYLKDLFNDPKSGLSAQLDKHGSRATVNTRAVGSHAFSLVPGEPKLKALLEDPRSFDEAMDDHIAKEKTDWDEGQKGTALRGEEDVADQLAMVRGYNGLAAAAPAIWNTIKAKPTLKEFRKALEAHLKSAYGDTQDEADASLGKFLVGNFVPPVPAAELEASLRKLAPKLGVPEDLVELVVSAAKADLDKIDPAKAGLPDIKAALKRAMEAEAIDTKGATAEAVRDGLRKPNGMVLCDSNWGDGAHRIKFAMVVNPMTDEMELWQMNEDGSDARKADKWLQKEWHAMV